MLPKKKKTIGLSVVMLECVCSLGRWSDNAMSYQPSVRGHKIPKAFWSFPCFKKKWAHLENLTNLRSQASLRKPCGSLITSESLNRVQPKNKNAFLILDGIAAQPEGTFFKLLARIIVDAKYVVNRKVRAMIRENYFANWIFGTIKSNFHQLSIFVHSWSTSEFFVI